MPRKIVKKYVDRPSSYETSVWFKDKSMRIRKKLVHGDRKFSPCNVCDVEGTLIGEENAKFYS